MSLLLPLLAVALLSVALGAAAGYAYFRARYFDDAGEALEASLPPSPPLGGLSATGFGALPQITLAPRGPLPMAPRVGLAPMIAELDAVRETLALRASDADAPLEARLGAVHDGLVDAEAVQATRASASEADRHARDRLSADLGAATAERDALRTRANESNAEFERLGAEATHGTPAHGTIRSPADAVSRA